MAFLSVVGCTVSVCVCVWSTSFVSRRTHLSSPSILNLQCLRRIDRIPLRGWSVEWRCGVSVYPFYPSRTTLRPLPLPYDPIPRGQRRPRTPPLPNPSLPAGNNVHLIPIYPLLTPSCTHSVLYSLCSVRRAAPTSLASLCSASLTLLLARRGCAHLTRFAPPTTTSLVHRASSSSPTTTRR